MRALNIAYFFLWIGVFACSMPSRTSRSGSATPGTIEGSSDARRIENSAEQAPDETISDAETFCVPPAPVTGSKLLNPSDNTCRGGDLGEGLPGFLTESIAAKVTYSSSNISIHAPAGTIKASGGDAQLGAVNIVVMQADESQLGVSSTAEITGFVLGLSHPTNDGAFTIKSLPLKNQNAVVIRVGGKVTDNVITKSADPAKPTAAWSKFGATSGFIPLLRPGSEAVATYFLYVTSITHAPGLSYPGFTNGLEADALCRPQSGSGNTVLGSDKTHFKAIIGARDSAGEPLLSPSERLLAAGVHSSGNFTATGVGGSTVTLATSLAQVFGANGGMASHIAYDENGNNQSMETAWSGTGGSGTLDNSCDGWTLSGSLDQGNYGTINPVAPPSEGTWLNTGPSACNTGRHLYCIAW